ncbi:MAG: hypothetical protein E7525_03920 [Ruminococcaceae bacterium]|nr:hypothetical protein [Oscillospiraceae bacterium]
MWRLKQAIYSFMYGRYGVDKLYWALLAVWIVLSVVNAFVGSVLLWVLETAVAGFAFFRVLSRNIYRRQTENAKFLKISAGIKSGCSLSFQRVRDIFKKRYRRCKTCKSVLRLPIKRGTNTVRCPKCGNAFKVTIII